MNQGKPKKTVDIKRGLLTLLPYLIIVCGVLFISNYFGGSRPPALLPERCTFPVSLTCFDHSVTASYVAISLQNSAGRDMIIRGMTATSDALGRGNMCSTRTGGGSPLSSDICPTSSGYGVQGCTGGPQLISGKSTIITMNQGACAFIGTGRDKNRYNITVYYSWSDSANILRTLPGEMLAKKP